MLHCEIVSQIFECKLLLFRNCCKYYYCYWIELTCASLMSFLHSVIFSIIVMSSSVLRYVFSEVVYGRQLAVYPIHDLSMILYDDGLQMQPIFPICCM